MAIRTHIKPRSPGSPRPTERRRLRQLAQMRQLGQRPTGPPPHTNGRRIRPYALRRRLPAEWAFPIASLHRSAAPSSPSRRGLHGAPHAAQLSPIRKLQCRVMGMLERVRHSLDALPRPGAACSSLSSSASSADEEASHGLQQHAGPLPSLGCEGSPAEVGPPSSPSDSHWESPPIGGGVVRQSEPSASLADSRAAPAPQPSEQWQSPAAWMCAEKEVEGRASRVLDGTLEVGVLSGHEDAADACLPVRMKGCRRDEEESRRGDARDGAGQRAGTLDRDERELRERPFVSRASPPPLASPRVPSPPPPLRRFGSLGGRRASISPASSPSPPQRRAPAPLDRASGAPPAQPLSPRLEELARPATRPPAAAAPPSPLRRRPSAPDLQKRESYTRPPPPSLPVPPPVPSSSAAATPPLLPRRSSVSAAAAQPLSARMEELARPSARPPPAPTPPSPLRRGGSSPGLLRGSLTRGLSQHQHEASSRRKVPPAAPPSPQRAAPPPPPTATPQPPDNKDASPPSHISVPAPLSRAPAPTLPTSVPPPSREPTPAQAPAPTFSAPVPGPSQSSPQKSSPPKPPPLSALPPRPQEHPIPLVPSLVSLPTPPPEPTPVPTQTPHSIPSAPPGRSTHLAPSQTTITSPSPEPFPSSTAPLPLAPSLPSLPSKPRKPSSPLAPSLPSLSSNPTAQSSLPPAPSSAALHVQPSPRDPIPFVAPLPEPAPPPLHSPPPPRVPLPLDAPSLPSLTPLEPLPPSPMKRRGLASKVEMEQTLPQRPIHLSTPSPPPPSAPPPRPTSQAPLTLSAPSLPEQPVHSAGLPPLPLPGPPSRPLAPTTLPAFSLPQQPVQASGLSPALPLVPPPHPTSQAPPLVPAPSLPPPSFVFAPRPTCQVPPPLPSPSLPQQPAYSSAPVPPPPSVPPPRPTLQDSPTPPTPSLPQQPVHASTPLPPPPFAPAPRPISQAPLPAPSPPQQRIHSCGLPPTLISVPPPCPISQAPPFLPAPSPPQQPVHASGLPPPPTSVPPPRPISQAPPFLPASPSPPQQPVHASGLPPPPTSVPPPRPISQAPPFLPAPSPPQQPVHASNLPPPPTSVPPPRPIFQAPPFLPAPSLPVQASGLPPSPPSASPFQAPPFLPSPSLPVHAFGLPPPTPSVSPPHRTFQAPPFLPAPSLPVQASGSPPALLSVPAPHLTSQSPPTPPAPSLAQQPVHVSAFPPPPPSVPPPRPTPTLPAHSYSSAPPQSSSRCGDETDRSSVLMEAPPSMSHVGQLAQHQSAPFSSQHGRRNSAPPLLSSSAGMSSCASRPPRASTSAPCSPDAHRRRRLLIPEPLHPSTAEEALPHPWAEHSARPREGEARTPSPRQQALQALLSRRRERLAGVEGMLVSGAAALFDIDASLRCAASRRRRLLELALSSPEEDDDSDDGEDVAGRREGPSSAHVQQPLEEQEPSQKEWDDLQERASAHASSLSAQQAAALPASRGAQPNAASRTCVRQLERAFPDERDDSARHPPAGEYAAASGPSASKEESAPAATSIDPASQTDRLIAAVREQMALEAPLVPRAAPRTQPQPTLPLMEQSSPSCAPEAGVEPPTPDEEVLAEAVRVGGWWTSPTPRLPAHCNLCYSLPPPRPPLPPQAWRSVWYQSPPHPVDADALASHRTNASPTVPGTCCSTTEHGGGEGSGAAESYQGWKHVASGSSSQPVATAWGTSGAAKRDDVQQEGEFRGGSRGIAWADAARAAPATPPATRGGAEAEDATAVSHPHTRAESDRDAYGACRAMAAADATASRPPLGVHCPSEPAAYPHQPLAPPPPRWEEVVAAREATAKVRRRAEQALEAYAERMRAGRTAEARCGGSMERGAKLAESTQRRLASAYVASGSKARVSSAAAAAPSGRHAVGNSEAASVDLSCGRPPASSAAGEAKGCSRLKRSGRCGGERYERRCVPAGKGGVRTRKAAASENVAPPNQLSSQTLVECGGNLSEGGGTFCAMVIATVCERLRSQLPSACASSHAVRALVFCVPSDAAGVPLQPEPLRELELWCVLQWGQVYVGTVPVPYSTQFQCAFPAISAASVQRVRTGGAVAMAAGATERYVVCIKLREEARMVEAINLSLSRSVG